MVHIVANAGRLGRRIMLLNNWCLTLTYFGLCIKVTQFALPNCVIPKICVLYFYELFNF